MGDHRGGGPLDAVRLLTVLPVPGGGDGPPRSGVGFFALAGWLLGAVAAALVTGAEMAGVDMGRNALLLAAGVSLTWAGLTRMLHWDGLADTADGIGGGRTPERRLEIMQDSRTGAFGAVAVALVAAVQVGAVASLVEAGIVWPLLAGPVLARAAASVVVWTARPARPEGLGASVSGRASSGGVVVAVFACVLLLPAIVGIDAGSVSVLGEGGNASIGRPLALLGLALPFVLGGFYLLARPVRGITGDTLGAGILIGETLVLALVALAG